MTTAVDLAGSVGSHGPSGENLQLTNNYCLLAMYQG